MNCTRIQGFNQRPGSGQGGDRSYWKIVTAFTVKGIKSLLGHAGFYRRLTKEFFSKITKPLCNLLEKKAAFTFDEDSLQVFEELKEKLVCPYS